MTRTARPGSGNGGKKSGHLGICRASLLATPPDRHQHASAAEEAHDSRNRFLELVSTAHIRLTKQDGSPPGSNRGSLQDRASLLLETELKESLSAVWGYRHAMTSERRSAPERLKEAGQAGRTLGATPGGARKAGRAPEAALPPSWVNAGTGGAGPVLPGSAAAVWDPSPLLKAAGLPPEPKGAPAKAPPVANAEPPAAKAEPRPGAEGRPATFAADGAAEEDGHWEACAKTLGLDRPPGCKLKACEAPGLANAGAGGREGGQRFMARGGRCSAMLESNPELAKADGKGRPGALLPKAGAKAGKVSARLGGAVPACLAPARPCGACIRPTDLFPFFTKSITGNIVHFFPFPVTLLETDKK